MARHLMTGNPEQPVAKRASARIEMLEALQGLEPDLLMQLLGHRPATSQKMVDESEKVPEMAAVHDRPGMPLSTCHRPEQPVFVVHRSGPRAVLLSPGDHCPQAANSFAHSPASVAA